MRGDARVSLDQAGQTPAPHIPHIMHINNYRKELERRGWETIASNDSDGRFYHAKHRQMNRYFAGYVDQFKSFANYVFSQPDIY
jgi:hypothetical protein